MPRSFPPSIGQITIGGVPQNNTNIRSLEFPSGGVSQTAPGQVTVSVPGAQGAQGPQGAQGNQGNQGNAGNTGLVGAGYSSFTAGSGVGTINTGGPNIVSFNFGTGFIWRMAHGASSQRNTQPDTAGTSVQNVQGVGTSTVTVRVVYLGGFVNGQAGVNFEASG